MKNSPLVENIVKNGENKNLDLHLVWGKMMLVLNSDLPLLSMCCSKVEKLILKENNNLEIIISEDGNLPMLEEEENYETIQKQLKIASDIEFTLNFKYGEKKVDKTNDRLNLVKSLFDKDILKIQKK